MSWAWNGCPILWVGYLRKIQPKGFVFLNANHLVSTKYDDCYIWHSPNLKYIYFSFGACQIFYNGKFSLFLSLSLSLTLPPSLSYLPSLTPFLFMSPPLLSSSLYSLPLYTLLLFLFILSITTYLSHPLSPSLGLSLPLSLAHYPPYLITHLSPTLSLPLGLSPLSPQALVISHLYIFPLWFFPFLSHYPSFSLFELLSPPHLSTSPLSRSLNHSFSTSSSLLSPLFLFVLLSLILYIHPLSK